MRAAMREVMTMTMMRVGMAVITQNDDGDDLGGNCDEKMTVVMVLVVVMMRLVI